MVSGEHKASSGADGADGAALRSRNRLGRERSPYLRQHAHNPVAWFAWGEDAFEEARRRDAPIFLSIGYATCYWCHVMERESFEDPRIGAIMSERFVCVKVDREERPDVDDIYMAAVQMLTGRGGWPMSVFLTPPGARGADDPGLEPYWGGTYFPPSPRHGLPSFEQLLEGMSDAWTNQREQALKQAGALTDAVRERLEARAAPVRLGADHVGRAVQELLGIYDDANGGFGSAPKFPQPVFVDLLLDAGAHMSDESHRRAAATAVRRTLDAMALGGVFDQVGGGFHRYSVDGHWTVPHFEKMLYDNAQLALTYARAYEAFGDAFYARIARRTSDYVLREMTAGGGAFYSAQDAEVNGREGLNYLWTAEEALACLSAEDAAYAIALYGLDGAPNFRDPHHPDEPARHVLRLRERPAPDEWERIDRINAALLAARARREQPRLDDKVIASWNGLMIGALADAGQALGEPTYVDAAQRAAVFLWCNLRDSSGAMKRVWQGDGATTTAILEDYAMLAHGLVRLHDALMALGRAAEGTESFTRAITLMREARDVFSDDATGAWFDTRAGAKDLLVRARSTHDGALPSAASMALHALLDLHERTNERTFLDDAGRLLAGMSAAVDESPLLCANTARALLRMLRTDPGVIERSGMTRESAERAHDHGAGAERAGVDADEAPVEVYADAERVSVGEGAPGELRLLVRIGEGWHITAHEPFGAGVADEDRIEGLEGLRVFVGGGAGVRAAVEYPEGEPLRLRVNDADAPGADGADALPPLRVHTSEVELRVRLERDGAPWSGRPMLYARYQPCTETECREAATVELDVAIDPV